MSLALEGGDGVFTMILTSALLAAVVGEDGDGTWSQFRGTHGAGVASGEATFPVEFGPDKNLLWRSDLAEGNSSPCIWGERIFLTGHREGELETICIDRTNGDLLWVRTVPAKHSERLHNINSLASPTPATDGERVYAYFGAFGLVCYDFEGEEMWRREIPPGQNTFGTASSPIVLDGLLILARDSSPESFLEAIDAESGGTIWRTERTGFGSGWSTPTVWERGDRRELVVLGVWWLSGYDLADGSELWSVPGLTDEPIVTPVMADGLVYVSSYNMKTNPEVIGLPEFDELLAKHDADGSGTLSAAEAEENESVLSRYDADGEGDHPLRIFFRFLDEDRNGELTPEEWTKLVDWLGGFQHKNALVAIRPEGADGKAEVAWQHSQGVPECPSPLLYRDRIFLVKNGGIASCLDARTGELKFEERLDSRGPCYASPVAGDGKIYTASARGVVTVFAAQDELDVLARNDLGERIMATPALVDGKIYVRTEKGLYAFGEKGPGEKESAAEGDR